MRGLTGLRVFLESKEEVVMRLAGRISWNVDSWVGFLVGGVIDEESDGGTQ